MQMGPLIIGPLLWFLGDHGNKDSSGVLHYDRPGYIAILMVGCICMFGSCILVHPIRNIADSAAKDDHYDEFQRGHHVLADLDELSDEEEFTI